MQLHSKVCWSALTRYSITSMSSGWDKVSSLQTGPAIILTAQAVEGFRFVTGQRAGTNLGHPHFGACAGQFINAYQSIPRIARLWRRSCCRCLCSSW